MRRRSCICLIALLILSIRAVQADTHYVSPTGLNTSPYTNWVTAATSIQSAVSAASSNDTVLVTNGTYTAGIVISDIRLESVNGPAVTIAQKTSSGRCFFMQGSAVLSGLTVKDGNAPGVNGGGILCADSMQIITNCIITGNTAANGGGIHGGTIYDSTIINNTANYGAGLHSSSAFNCVFSGNSAINYGGGLYLGSAENCAFIGNHAGTRGGGLSDGVAINCTLSGNSAGYGGGLFGSTATNSIIWYNTAGVAGNNIQGTSTQYSCSPDVTHGVDGNITNAPIFVDKDNGNCRLRWISPCLNAGTNAMGIGGTDLDGKTRILYGTVDMGAYEAVDSDIDDLSDAEEIALHGTDPFDEDSDEDGLSDGDEVNTHGTDPLVDADFDTDELSDSDEINIYGTDPMDADTDNDTLPDGYEVLNGFDPKVFDAIPNHYVSLNGSHSYPYVTWSTAATNIQAAVAVAVSNDTVVVSNGTYTVGIVFSDIRLESLNGPEVTVAQKTSYGRCFWLQGSAVLSGFTVINGDASGGNGGGIFCDDVSQVITNCIVTGNTADSGGGIYRGTVNDCTISNNTATMDGAGIANGAANRCLINGNTAGRHGGGIYCIDASQIITNCIVTGNMATEFGGGIFGGTAIDCTISSNTATIGGAGIATVGAANRCVINGNTAGNHGGGMLSGTANNCLFTGNSAVTQGGGMSNGTANNCTISSNSANHGGGMYNGSANNSIVWYNTAGSAGNNIDGTVLQHSCSENVVVGINGNISSMPQFVDRDSGDYRLLYGSGCINSGNNTDVVGTNDLAGDTRIIDGLVDMGAYEYNPGVADSDGDGLLDEYEFLNGLSLTRPTDLNALVQSNANTYSYYTAAYIESNPDSFGLYTPSAVLDLALGDIGVQITNGMAELSVQLWQSEDLITWTNIGGTVYWAEPVDADKKFFRVRAEP